jgi:endonuclease-3 related protein
MSEPKVSEVYQNLFDKFGPQKWWPGETRLEVIIGAVLTQNTAWQNVEKAIKNLKNEGLIDVQSLMDVEPKMLAELIRPSGYYNIKSLRLKEVITFLSRNRVKSLRLKEVITFLSRNRGIENLLDHKSLELRNNLLKLNGVGEETADSILLYAFQKPIFVVDAYTKRVFSRVGLLDEGMHYGEVQTFFEKNLKKDAALYNEYHALIVKLGKEYCKKKEPLCNGCPIRKVCKYPG